MYSLQLREKQKTRILNICNIEAMRVVIKRREGKSTPSMDIVKKETQNRGTRSLPNHDEKKKRDAIHHESTAIYPYMLKPQN